MRLRGAENDCNTRAFMVLTKILSRVRTRGHQRDAAHGLYASAVSQARAPVFYTDCGAQDTMEGRFDMIVLHVYLIMRALKRLEEPGSTLSQRLFDVMFADMDQSLREMGVGDLSVGKKIKAMASAFFGRTQAYDDALDDDAADQEALATALRRNVVGAGDAPDGEGFPAFVTYVAEAARAIEDQSGPALLAGQVRFPVPPAATSAEAPGNA